MSDIFISYAHVDNDPLAPAPRGWVSIFVENLEKLLAKHLGRRDAYTLWMDNELRGNQPIDPGILGKLKEAKIFLLFLSPGYRASKWCQTELQTFLERFTDDQSRIFVVELDNVERPAGLNLKGYRFWVVKDNNRPSLLATPEPNPSEKEYYSYLDDLARDLSEQIERFAKVNPALAEGAQEHEATVYLAQVPDSLHNQRESVRRYLEQLNIRVLPKGLLNPLDLQNSIKESLKEADLFVQLLDADAGQTFPRVQYELCETTCVPIMQWRSCGEDLTSHSDTDHIQLLEGNNIIVASVTDFEGMLKKRLLQDAQEVQSKKSSSNLFVYVDTSEKDWQIAQETSKLLNDMGVAHSLPLQPEPGMSPREIRDDIENNLKNCDAVMMIFCHGPVSQLRNHLMICQRINARREEPIKIVAAFMEPERDPGTLNIKFRGLAIYDDSPTASIQSFLETAER